MDRNREARRATMVTSAGTNGLSRRRHRSNSLRDSPEEDGVGVELQETVRLRERKKERDRERSSSSRSKRLRGGGVGDSNRLMMHREDAIGDDTSEEDDSVNDDHGVDDEDDDDRMLPPPSNPSSSSFSNHHHHQHQHHPHRKSFPPPPPTKVFRPPWKPADDHIGVSVPRKARSASTKRGHDWSGSGPSSTAGSVVGGEQSLHRQASTSPVRTSVVVQAPTASPSRISPSSSNISIRKKMKPANGGSKHRQPLKTSSKSSPTPSNSNNLTASNQDEIEIEIAEVLYGMMRQPQGASGGSGGCPARPDGGTGATNATTDYAKSRNSSPVSNSSPLLTQNSSSANTPVTATAPKRKRPRQLPEENSRSGVTVKAETEQLVKLEAVEKSITGSVVENGGISFDLGNHSRVGPPALSEQIQLDSKPLTDQQQHQQVTESRKDESHSASPRNGPPPDSNREDSVPSKLNLMVTESEGKREEKFQIDLMAPPPQTKSSPERDGDTSFAAPETKKMVPHVETEIKTVTTTTTQEDEKRPKIMKEDMGNAVETDEKHVKRAILEESEQCKPVVNKERFNDLQPDLPKNAPKQTQQQQQQQLQQTPPPQIKSSRDEPNNEKNAQSSSSLPMQMPLANWPGGFSPMGYMPPLQGVMPIDGRNVSAATVQPPQLLLNQPRPKRCATHCYIARNIAYHQQFTRMNPFWPAAAGNASLYGAKPCNLNVVPSTELHANFRARNGNSVQDKGHASAASHAAKEKGSHTPNNTDAAQRKQVVLQQTVPSGAPNNILHGPAFIFPLSQQQAAAAAVAASARSTSGRTASATVSGPASSNSNAITVGASAAAAMTFNYPNVPANETQYLAILPNNGYPFPIPANVGASPAAYRGPHAQAMPFFNGSFFSSQMLHPGQQQQSSPQALQIQHSSGGLHSAQKHLQNQPQQQQQQQQRSESNGASGSGSLHQTFQVPKNRSSQSAQHQNQHISLPQQSRLPESGKGGGSQDNPSASDNHGHHANMSVYGQNFAMPIHASNFALMTPVALGGTGGSANNNHNEKKLQQSQQHQGMKPGMDSMPSQAFAVTFASLNGGATPGLDISSVAAQNHAILQNFTDPANRQGYQFLTASSAGAQASQQKKNIRGPEGKSGGGSASDNSNTEEERKSMAAKASNIGQSIAFSRSDAVDSSISNVIDSSARSLNLVSGPGRASGSLVSGPMNNTGSPSPQQRQQQQQHQQHQQLIQLHKQQQQQYTAMTSRNKMPATGNGNVYLDHLPSSSAMAAAKFPSAFPQNLVQSNSGSPTQSPQWKNSSRTTTSQAHSPSISSSTSSSQKNIPQQQGRPQQGHMSISFGGNPKSSASPQVHPPPGSSNQTPSPVMVGSPTASTMSKGASGSPRTTASNSGSRTGQVSTFSSSTSQQGKNSSTVSNRKSSPVGGKNVPSILGNPHITSSSSASVKPQLAQQQHNHLPKQAMQQAQLIFSNHYVQPSQAPHSTGSNASPAPSVTPGAYYSQRQGGQKQSQGPSSTTSSAMLSLYPSVSLANASSMASPKTVAAGNNMKGGVPQGMIHAPQFASVNQQLLPAGFPYVHSVATVKPAEQKQPADE